MVKDSFSLLCSVWNEIGPFNMDRFSDRLLLQKKVFLLQEIGLNFGYSFGKYRYGPYCSSLASDGYKMNIKNNSENNDNCDPKFLKVLKELEKGHEKDTAWFELLGTITYLNKKMSKKKNEVKQIVAKEKPYLFEEALFEEAYSRLASAGLVSS